MSPTESLDTLGDDRLTEGATRGELSDYSRQICVSAAALLSKTGGGGSKYV
jgi:hypothetical protein